MKNNIVFLGQANTTFSSLAYEVCSQIFQTPRLANNDSVFHSVRTNEEIIPTLVRLGGGHGVIAMGTEAEGRVTKSLESFDSLLRFESHPIRIVGALKKKLNFALMVRKGMTKGKIKKVAGHPNSFGACQKNISKHRWETIERPSNGQAAEDVARKDGYEEYAALGPSSAAEVYGLSIIENAFEDEEAVTTFFHFGPMERNPVTKENNRSLVVCKLEDKAGALWPVLRLFDRADLNLHDLHHVYSKKGADFLIQVDVPENKIDTFHKTMRRFQRMCLQSLVFGPFGIVEK